MAFFKKEAQWLIVGLGNPGDDYADTRHNAGFNAMDYLAAELGARYWKSQDGALVSFADHGGVPLALVKPQTFMNLSGTAVGHLAKRYDVMPGRIVVIHDEMDLEPGDVRVKRGGGTAGHNGLKSIRDHLGTSDYPRVRVGIGRPPGRMQGADYVLQQLRKDDLEAFRGDCAIAGDAALEVVSRGVDRAMADFNGRHRAE